MNYTSQYLSMIKDHLDLIVKEEKNNINSAAKILAKRIKEDQPIFAYGPGGHSNLGTQEIFFRAGGLMHINPILDEGTLLSSGALRSMAIERLAGYGTIVMKQSGIKKGDVLLLINAYGINSALIDAALYAKENGITLIAVTSIEHAKNTSKDHPARHPSKKNLYELADITLDCKIQPGDAVISIENVEQKIGAMSTFANSFILNSLILETVDVLSKEGIVPPIWRSGNVAGGDEWNNQFISQFTNRIPKL